MTLRELWWAAQGRRQCEIVAAMAAWSQDLDIDNYIETGSLGDGQKAMPYDPQVMAALAGLPLGA